MELIKLNIAVTGNLGYIGSVLVPTLINKGHKVLGIDVGYYKDCILYNDNNDPANQLMKDIRDIEAKDLDNIDAVIHLAALSNDPLGELLPSITEDINFNGTLRVAECAKKAGVKRFVYASSQSMYGVSKISDELDEDNSEKNPVTAYARTKWEAEQELANLNSNDFSTVYFRPSTVFGASKRLRCDIVYNNLVSSAYTKGKIELLSDGTPWRPVVHINDVSNAFIAGIEAPLDLVKNKAFNVGVPNGNYTVRDLAESASNVVKDSKLVFTNKHKDPRTYKVSFKRILEELNEYYIPKWELISGGNQLVSLYDKIGFTEKDFSGEKCNRLKQLKNLMDKGIISEQLRLQ
jgi:nucleoside-diphosphate-sugar epimerase